MIFEWAELGNLKEVYNSRKLSWKTKLYIARDVSRGLGFLHVIGKVLAILIFLYI
jgi:hypothetical protein